MLDRLEDEILKGLAHALADDRQALEHLGHSPNKHDIIDLADPAFKETLAYAEKHKEIGRLYCQKTAISSLLDRWSKFLKMSLGRGQSICQATRTLKLTTRSSSTCMFPRLLTSSKTGCSLVTTYRRLRSEGLSAKSKLCHRLKCWRWWLAKKRIHNTVPQARKHINLRENSDAI